MPGALIQSAMFTALRVQAIDKSLWTTCCLMQSIAVFSTAYLFLVATSVITRINHLCRFTSFCTHVKRRFKKLLWLISVYSVFFDNVSTDVYCNLVTWTSPGELQEGAIHLSHPSCFLPMPPNQIQLICWVSRT
jgi:hypothetical protein